MKKTLFSSTLLLLLSVMVFAQPPGVRVNGAMVYRGQAGHSSPGKGYGHYNTGAQKQTLTEVSFRRVKQEILSRNSHRGRLLNAREVADRYLLTSSMVERIMVILGTDADRVDFAKYAFPSVIDTERFDIVLDAVSFQSSKMELRRFMRDQGLFFGPGNGVGNGHGHSGPGSCGTTGTSAGCGTQGNWNSGSSCGTQAPSCGIQGCTGCQKCGGGGFSGGAGYGSQGGWNQGGHNHGGAGYMVMRPQEFEGLKARIRSMTFESTKEEIMEIALRENLFTANQVKELLFLFTFESTKLDLAKKAYARTVDTQSYYVVYDVFTFESSIRRLNEFIYG